MGMATGILEVFGLVAAFVACDAGCKAADVTVEHFDKNKPGNADELEVPLIVNLGIGKNLYECKDQFIKTFDIDKNYLL